ncbi:MAG: N-acetyl-gamma-glutamyl-phosphate reductase [bacterium]|nr:N-acetyl-gamma-glutamyl-phosphate reductase [bacterium]
MIRVSIIGAASYTAGELIKILVNHPKVKLVHLEETGVMAGKKIAEVFPSLKSILDMPILEHEAKVIAKGSDVVFICRGAGGSMSYVAELFKESKKVRVIDIGSDFRLKNPADYSQWYQYTHEQPKLLKESVYGLPEFYAKEIRKARLVANPGCYPTSIIFGLAPVLAKGSIDPAKILIASYSGISGAGRMPKAGVNMFLDVYGNAKPYRVATHQHTPEIEQELTRIAKNKVSVTFIPHILPIGKGILSTIFVEPKKKIGMDSVLSLYCDFYKGKPFIRIYPKGELPQLINVVNTNFCDIGVGFDKRTGALIIFSAIDNSVKGAGGQAVQNMNLMFGISETTGLL